MKQNPHYMMLHNECDTCVAWNLMSISSLMDYDYPKYYSTVSELTATKMIPREVTFGVLNTLDVAGDKTRKGI